MSSNSGVEIGWGEIMIMIVALVMLAMMPAISADNIAPATLSQHAVEKHGADAQRGLAGIDAVDDARIGIEHDQFDIGRQLREQGAEPGGFGLAEHRHAEW